MVSEAASLKETVKEKIKGIYLEAREKNE